MLTLLLSLLPPCQANIYEGYHIVSFKDNVLHAHQLKHIELIQAKYQESQATQRTKDGGMYNGVKAHYKHLKMYYIHAHDELINHIRDLAEVHLVEPEGYLTIAKSSDAVNEADTNEADADRGISAGQEILAKNQIQTHTVQCQDDVLLRGESGILGSSQQVLQADVVAPKKPKMIRDLYAPAGLGRISHKLWDDWSWSPFQYVYDPNVISHPVVYIMDTGVQIDHIEFEGRVSNGPFCGYCTNADDEQNHGTHVLGTILGKTVGVARTAKAVSLKVIGRSKKARTSSLLDAFEFVMSEPIPNKLKVVNMSLYRGFYDASLNRAVSAAGWEGVHVVVAAGNDAVELGFESPQSALGSVVVGSIDASDTKLWDSNWGHDVDFVAPGENILSSSAGSSNKYYKMQSGTSMATPHITGVICYMLGLYGPMSPSEVRAKLYEWSTEIPAGFGEKPRARILYNGSGF